MWNDTDIFRPSYLAASTLPLLIAVIATGQSLLEAAPLLIGWALLGIAQNVLNDVFDQDRDLPLDLESLTVLYLVATVLGLMLLRPVLPYALIFIGVYGVYNRWFTGHWIGVGLNTVGFAIIPFLSLSGPLTYLPLVAGYGLFGALVEMWCDADIPDTAHIRYTILLTGIAGGIYTLYLIKTRPDTVYLLPFAAAFFAAAAQPPRHGSVADKIALVYATVLATVYLLGVVAAHGILLPTA